jgi:ribosome maturation factor RimP
MALAPVVAAQGLDLEQVDVAPAGRRRVVRVVVDKDGGVTLDEIADATRLVSQQLDEHDLMDEQPYTLEITSPGVDRPLTQPRHWRRNVGRLVKVTGPEADALIGRVVDADEQAARMDIDGATREIPYSAMRRAQVQVEFNRKEGRWTST